MATVSEKINRQLKTMPHSPGVYLIKDKFGEIIYVGKAKNLNKRLRSHFTPSNDFSKSQFIRQLGEEIEVMEVSNEVEAFLLEYNLIQEHQPKLNTHWKDGKSYPVVEITAGETFPRIRMTRDPKQKDSLYLGPFANVKSLKQSLKYGLQMFPVADCSQEIHLGDAETWAKTCMRRRTKTCLRPCEVEVDPEKYREELQNLVDFLEGRIPTIITKVEKRMKDAAANLEFEKAAEYRDILKGLTRTLQRQHVVVEMPDSFVIVCKEVDDAFGFNVVKVVNERVVQQTPVFVLKEEMDPNDENPEESFVQRGVMEILGAHRLNQEIKRVLNATEFESLKATLETIGYRVAKARAKDKPLILLAEKNLKDYVRRQLAIGKKSTQQLLSGYSKRVLDLQKMLDLETPPSIIDTFDISTLQGTNTVGSCVRFVNGKPFKKGYRRFKIRTVEGQDDFASMREAVQRRYDGNDGVKDKFGLDLPELIVIDGGQIQLNKAKEALQEVGLSHVPVVGLAKKLEEIYFDPTQPPLLFKKNRPGMLLIRSGRDEAHRFAVTYHRKRREKEGLKSILDDISGIGQVRKKRLLQEYKTVSNIAKESSETLSDKLKIPREVASEVIFACRRFNDALEARETRRSRFKRK